MAISEQVIDQIRTASDIVSVVRDYVPDLKKAGRNWKCCCPFHSEKTPSFVVSPEKGIFRCFGCNVAGDVFKFIMLVDNISWIEAVKKLALKSNIQIEESYNEKVTLSEKSKIFEILESAAKFYHRHFLESSSASFARDYVAKRGLTKETVYKFMIGYAPKGKLIESALKKGYSYEILTKAGLITKTDRGSFFEYMSERLIFPIFDVQGRVVAFGGRTLTDQQVKYLNTPETVVYSKSSNLYGLFQTLSDLRKEKRILLLEGYMDVVVTQQYGVSGAVASLGTSFTQQQAKLISRYADKTILLFDADDAGRNATQRALEIFAENDIDVQTASLPDGFDPDEYLVAYGKESFDVLLEKSSKSAIDFMIDRESVKTNVKTSQNKAKIVSVILDFIAKNKNSIVQREYIKNLSQKFNLDEEIVWLEFKKKKTNKIINNVSDSVSAQNEKQHGKKRSLEEELIFFMLDETNRKFTANIKDDFFQSVLCGKIYKILKDKQNISVAEIMSKLADKELVWFSEFAVDGNVKYQFPEEVFNILVRDIEFERLDKKRKLLEKEVLLMLEGKAKEDKIKLQEYKKLTSQIKGSGNK